MTVIIRRHVAVIVGGAATAGAAEKTMTALCLHREGFFRYVGKGLLSVENPVSRTANMDHEGATVIGDRRENMIVAPNGLCERQER